MSQSSSVLSELQTGIVRKNIVEFLKAKGWVVNRCEFTFSQIKGQWKPFGDRGCPLFRATKVIRPGYTLEFWVQPAAHGEPDEYKKWCARALGRGVLFVEVESEAGLSAWYDRRWAWLEHPQALERLAGQCIPVEY